MLEATNSEGVLAQIDENRQLPAEEHQRISRALHQAIEEVKKNALAEIRSALSQVGLTAGMRLTTRLIAKDS